MGNPGPAGACNERTQSCLHRRHDATLLVQVRQSWFHPAQCHSLDKGPMGSITTPRKLYVVNNSVRTIQRDQATTYVCLWTHRPGSIAFSVSSEQRRRSPCCTVSVAHCPLYPVATSPGPSHDESNDTVYAVRKVTHAAPIVAQTKGPKKEKLD